MVTLPSWETEEIGISTFRPVSIKINVLPWSPGVLLKLTDGDRGDFSVYLPKGAATALADKLICADRAEPGAARSADGKTP